MFEPLHGLFRFVHLSGKDFLGYFPADAGRADNESFVVQFQVLRVCSWTHIVAVNPGTGYELNEVVVARLVLGQYDQMPARLVYLAFLQLLVSPARHIHLTPEDGHEVCYAPLLFNGRP